MTIVTPKDDLAAAIEKIGQDEGTVQLGKGVFYLRRPVEIPPGTIIEGRGGFGHRGVGTEIIQAFTHAWAFRFRACGGMRHLSITAAKTITAGSAIYLDGSKNDSRVTWFELEQVKLPAYKDASIFQVGLFADGSAWTESGNEGVRDLVLHGFYAYGCKAHAVLFRRVVNASLTACAFGPGSTATGQYAANIEIENSDSIHFATSTLWGNLTVRKCRNGSWEGGRLDGYYEYGCEDWKINPCNKPTKFAA